MAAILVGEDCQGRFDCLSDCLLGRENRLQSSFLIASVVSSGMKVENPDVVAHWFDGDVFRL